MSLIDVGQSLKEFATEVEADFPSKPLMNKSSKKIMIDKVEEEAINEKMKVLEVNKKADESVTAEDESMNPVQALLTKFRAEILGEFDASADKVKEALRKHFKECGTIKRIKVKYLTGFRYAVIDFTSRGSLNKALQLNNTEVDGHRVTVTVRHSRSTFHRSSPYKFRAVIYGFRDIDLKELTQRVETTCGGIAGTRYKRTCVWIDFTNLDSLNKALELDNVTVDGQCIRVKKCINRFAGMK